MWPIMKIMYMLVTTTLLLGIVSLFLPSEVYVERSMVIHAPAWQAYEQVYNLRNWEKWSPWKQSDPAIKLNYQGPQAGNGAQYSWESRKPAIGDGKLIIADSEPNQEIVTEMYFANKGKGTATHTFKETPEGTLVTWAVNTTLGKNPVRKYLGLLWGSIIGPDFERGLANLKLVVEDSAAKDRRRQTYRQH